MGSVESEEDLNPVSLILVSSDSGGGKLLFMYPYDKPGDNPLLTESVSANPYCVKPEVESQSDSMSLIREGYLSGLADEEIMGHLFNLHKDLCNQRFELKINDARFVGFPMQFDSSRRFILMFVLRASASRAVVSAYQELSKRVSLALVHEETRCQYFSSQASIMDLAKDNIHNLPEAESANDSPYRLMLESSELAQHLQNIFTDVTEMGACSMHINGWVEISFCLPQKVYAKLGIPPVSFENLESSLRSLRPFHSMLLLEEAQDIIAALPVDSSPALCRLLRNQSTISSLQTIANDIDLPMSQVCSLVRHLVCWGKAIVIFPVCENNVYTVSPYARIEQFLAENFAEIFSGKNLMVFLSEFSPPISLGEFLNPVNHDLKDQTERIEIILWLLQRRLIMQLHTYVYLSLPEKEEERMADTSQGESERAKSLLSQEKQDEIGRDFQREDVFRAALACLKHSALNEKQAEEELRLFSSLVPYFNGKHHLEDMMFCLNCKRTELFRVLDRFRSFLVTTLKHDTLAAGFEH